MAKTESAPGEPPGRAFAVAGLRQEERRDAAYRAAWEEIDGLEPGEAIQYHEGNLVADVAKDPEIAGRAAAYRHAATDTGQGHAGAAAHQVRVVPIHLPTVRRLRWTRPAPRRSPSR